MKTKCYSVRLESLYSYSDKSYKATAYDGSIAFIPRSCVFGVDYSVSKSNAYWIAAWILEKRDLQYSSKKAAWFDENGNMIPETTIEIHIPDNQSALPANKIETLKK